MGTLRIAFAGTFAASLEGRVRAHLTLPCDVRVSDEAAIVPLMPDVDVLVTMGFTREMGQGAKRLKLVQVPGAGLDRSRGRSWRGGHSASSATDASVKPWRDGRARST